MFRTSLTRSLGTISRSGAYAFIPRTTSIATRLRFQSSVPPASKPALTPAEEAAKQARKLSFKLQEDWDAKILKYEELKPRTESPTSDTYLIDVREPDEVIQGMIPSAVNLPLTSLSDSLHLSGETFLEKHGFEKPRKDEQIIFYCRSGKRSASACDIAKRNGYTNLLNYEGSWLEWVEKENKQGK